jgi:diacylglycerol kinase family enzyme
MAGLGGCVRGVRRLPGIRESAYFVSGMRALRNPRASITLAVDGRIEPPRQVRTVVVGNCGGLLAGLVLMPAAKVEDGLLDVVAIGPRGMIGWLAVTTRVLALARPHRHHQRGAATAGPPRR